MPWLTPGYGNVFLGIVVAVLLATLMYVRDRHAQSKGHQAEIGCVHEPEEAQSDPVSSLTTRF